MINDNGISAIALAFFTALFAAVSAIVVQLLQIKAKASEARDVALETKMEAEQARKNTEHTSNGFAGDVDRKLNKIITSQERLTHRIENHLEWHINNPPSKG